MKEKKEKNLKKIQEEKILEVVNRYKLLICHQIKSGNSFNQEALLFDSGSSYNSFWKFSSENTLSDEEREILRINFILASLPVNQKELIWKEFFFNEDKFWWMGKYNRSTYYRLKTKAINNFYSLLK